MEGGSHEVAAKRKREDEMEMLEQAIQGSRVPGFVSAGTIQQGNAEVPLPATDMLKDALTITIVTRFQSEDYVCIETH